MGDQSAGADPVVIGERDHVMVTREIHLPMASPSAPSPYINPIGDSALILKKDSVGIVKRVGVYTEIPRDKDIPIAYVVFSLGALDIEICVQCSDLLLIYKAE